MSYIVPLGKSVRLKTGRVIKGSGKNGKKPVPIVRDVPLFRDITANVYYERGKYLPHQGVRECERRRAA